MKAEDINLADLLDFRPEAGQLLLNGQRMLIFSQAALRSLNELLVEHLGHEFAGAVFTQFGYRCGHDDYQVIAGDGDWDSDLDRLASGPAIHMWEGIVHVEPTVIEFDRATGAFLMTGLWRNSFEAENHLEAFGLSATPVCASLTGYASGWSSAFFGRPLLAIETSCLATGDDHCAFEIRPLDSWDGRADPWRTALAATSKSISSLLEQRVADRTRDLEATNRVLAEAKDEAVRANNTKMQFLANISHELRTPMNGVIGIAQLLKDTQLDRRQLELVELIVESGSQQVAIITDLLDYAKIEAGEAEVEQRSFDFSGLLTNVVGTYQAQAFRSGVRLELAPVPADLGRVVSDSLKISQVLSNLLSNAIKFTPRGGSVLVTADLAGRDVHLSVADTGIGMSAEQLQKLFAPFSQADASITRRYGGTGLGLAICRDLVTLLGGELSVESAEGVGTQFGLRLPLAVDSPAEVDPDPAADRWPAELGSKAALEVLVAEDNKVNAMVISAMLESLNCRVTLTCDGAEAVAAYLAQEFDLLLLDLHMPVMDGLKVVELVRSHERSHGLAGVPIVAFTADAYDETRQVCLAAGFSEFLTKPALKEDVARVVADAFQVRLEL
ncbi:MAG TPA: ATP-binding protein [Actinomycetota bacterium]|nr:ATP-binding protein [Actinomycetota bacterium]